MFGEDAIAQQLADARATLSTAIKSPEAGQVEPVTVEGADGLLRVTVGVEGRIDGFEFDPRIMRIGTDEPVPDLEAINESVAEIQDRSLRQFQAMSASISEVMAKIHGGK
jgi:hypothetical protein